MSQDSLFRRHRELRSTMRLYQAPNMEKTPHCASVKAKGGQDRFRGPIR